MFFIYILYSQQADKYYLGQTENVEERLTLGISPYTSIANDWKLMYTEQFETRNEAIRRENEIKKKKSRKYIEWLISSNKIN